MAVAIAASAVAAACSFTKTPTSPTDGSSPPAAPGVIALASGDWRGNGSSLPIALRNEADGTLTFDFPDSDSMNILYSTRPPQQIVGTVAIDVAITTNGPVLFDQVTEPANTCTAPAAAHPFFWANQNGTGEFDRWWSNPSAFPMTSGSMTLEIPVEPSRWSSVQGKFGDHDADTRAAFAKAIRNVSRIGLTFGGGCFYGHGIVVRGGRAAFTIRSYRIQG